VRLKVPQVHRGDHVILFQHLRGELAVDRIVGGGQAEIVGERRVAGDAPGSDRAGGVVVVQVQGHDLGRHLEIEALDAVEVLDVPIAFLGVKV
jgi:hypothetical protein